MKQHTSIKLFIIFYSLVPATLQCSISEKIKRSSTIESIALTHNCDSDDNFEHHSEKFNNATKHEALERYGLLDSPQEALKKHQDETKDLSQATSAQEAIEIFNRSYTKKKSGSLSIMQYAVLSDLPKIALLLLDAGHSIDPIDKIRFKTQLKMLDRKQAVSEKSKSI